MVSPKPTDYTWNNPFQTTSKQGSVNYFLNFILNIFDRVLNLCLCLLFLAFYLSLRVSHEIAYSFLNLTFNIFGRCLGSIF
jgi:hypothetical protein